jgi:hypothetical protein
MSTDVRWAVLILDEGPARATTSDRSGQLPTSAAVAALVIVGARLTVSRWDGTAKILPIFAVRVGLGVAISARIRRIFVLSAIIEAGHHVVGVAAAALDELTHFSARETESLDTAVRFAQIGPMYRERLVLAQPVRRSWSSRLGGAVRPDRLNIDRETHTIHQAYIGIDVALCGHGIEGPFNDAGRRFS